MTNTKFRRGVVLAAAMLSVLLLSACQAPTASDVEPYDYTAFKAAKPRSILVLPPTNESVEVGASYSFLSQATAPLAEGGYYVLPVTLVDRIFRENGLSSAADIHNVSAKKLNEIFDADAALYINVKDFGTKFLVFDSVTSVTAEAKLVDLKTGEILWSGFAAASDAEGRSGGGGGLLVQLVAAVIQQVVANVVDKGDKVAAITAVRLLSPGLYDGALLVGPRHPNYETETETETEAEAEVQE